MKSLRTLLIGYILTIAVFAYGNTKPRFNFFIGFNVFSQEIHIQDTSIEPILISRIGIDTTDTLMSSGMYQDNIWHREAFIKIFSNRIEIIDLKGDYKYGTYFLDENGMYVKKENSDWHIKIISTSKLEVYHKNSEVNDPKLRYLYKKILQ